MVKETHSSQVILEKNMAGGICIVITDMSRRMAGDRWLIKINCEAKVPVAEEYWSAISHVNEELQDCIRNKIGSHAIYSTTQKRTFIAEDEKDTVIKSIINTLEENALKYIANPEFPKKLFFQKYKTAQNECMLEQQKKTMVELEDDDDGSPADFSHLFK